tara:strand:+ start:1033 stop:1218 length:186 start_codon:yes stop_codon:yes gene_type:complete
MIAAQLTDLVEAIQLLKTAKSAGLSVWEGVIMILFILKDVAMVGGILGTIIWYVRRRDGWE